MAKRVDALCDVAFQNLPPLQGLGICWTQTRGVARCLRTATISLYPGLSSFGLSALVICVDQRLKIFRQLREHYQKRHRLRLIVDYRKKFLDSLVRGGDEEANQAEANYEQA